MSRTSKSVRQGAENEPMQVPDEHAVLGTPIEPPFPDDTREVLVGMGCFWAPEQRFWNTEGVYTTAVGYAGGDVPHPTYKQVCNGGTGHAEVVRVVFHPEDLSEREVFEIFWQHHDPTGGLGGGIDRTSQYRSALFVSDDDQLDLARSTRAAHQEELHGEVVTDIRKDVEFYYAEPYHQQYKAKRSI